LRRSGHTSFFIAACRLVCIARIWSSTIESSSRLRPAKVLEANAYGQVLNYLRAADLTLGLLIHFGPSGVTVKRVICSPEYRPRDR